MFRRHSIIYAALTGFGLLLGTGAVAQGSDWPAKPVRLVVPGPAGSGMGIYARLIAEPL